MHRRGLLGRRAVCFSMNFNGALGAGFLDDALLGVWSAFLNLGLEILLGSWWQLVVDARGRIGTLAVGAAAGSTGWFVVCPPGDLPMREVVSPY